MNNTISQVIDFLRGPNNTRTSRIRRHRNSVYDYYSTLGKAQFIELPQAWLIVEFYERFDNFLKSADAEPAVASYEAKRFLQFALLCAQVHRLTGKLASENMIRELGSIPGVNDRSSLMSVIE